MSKLFALIFALCNCCLYAQLPVVSIPKVSSLGRVDTHPYSSSSPSAPSINKPSQFGSYDQDKLLQQRQRARREINEAIVSMRETEQRQSTVLHLIKHGFPSWANEQGTENFRDVYQELKGMLNDSIPLNLERAVFLIENAYNGNILDFEMYRNNIEERVGYCKWRMKELKLNPNDGLAKNMAIFSLLTDTLNIKQPGTEKMVTHYPLKYNLDDYDSKKDYTSHFVTTLLSTNVGQCYSMPLLYLIMAERLGANAYLSLAPHHSFVKIQDDKGAWYNLELTCRSILSDYHYLNNSYIKSEAIRNKLYLTPLSKKETIASMLVILGKYYQKKYGYDPFVLDCMHEAKQHFPTSIDAKMMEADYETRLTLEIARLLNTPNPEMMRKVSPDAYKHYERMQELYKEIDDSGYEDMPQEIYERWLKHVDKLKNEDLRSSQSVVRKIVK